jgi:hypothetical protein
MRWELPSFHRSVLKRSSAMSAVNPEPASVTIIGHSNLFYWWPVWAVGFVMAAITYVDGSFMAIVPNGTVAEKARLVQGIDGPRDLLILPAGRALPVDDTGAPEQLRLRVARSNGLGAVFVTILLLVLVITNVRLSGVKSLIPIILVLLISVIFAVTGMWDVVFRLLGSSDVHITATGYLCLATPLFLIWLLTFLFYDRLTYATFSPGQFTIHYAFGAGAQSYEVQNLNLEKMRDDLFRHWLLGAGSGDLVIRTGGANKRTYELPNVLFVGSKVISAQRLLRERQVVKG